MVLLEQFFIYTLAVFSHEIGSNQEILGRKKDWFPTSSCQLVFFLNKFSTVQYNTVQKSVSYNAN